MKKIIYILTLFIVGAFDVLSQKQELANADWNEDNVVRAMQCLQDEQYKTAIQYLEAAIVANPANLAPYVLTESILERHNLLKNIVFLYTDGLLNLEQQEVGDSKIKSQMYLRRAVTLRKIGILELALADVEKAQELDESAESWTVKAYIETGMGQLAEAESDYKKAVSQDYNKVRWHLDLGNFYKNNEKHAEALTAFNNALSVAKMNDDGEAITNCLGYIALMNMRLGNAQEGVKNLVYSIDSAFGREVDDDYWNVLCTEMFDVLAEKNLLGDFAEAVDAERGVDPQTKFYMFQRLAMEYEKKPDVYNAVVNMLYAADTNYGNRPAPYFYATLYLTSIGLYDEARNLIEQARASMKQLLTQERVLASEFDRLEGNVEFAQGNYAKALSLYKPLTFESGMAMAAMGEYDRAIKTLDSFIEDGGAKVSAVAYIERAILERLSGKEKEAAADFSRLLANGEEGDDAVYALSLAGLGENAKAVSALKRFDERKYVGGLCNAALASCLIGEWDKAVAYLEVYLQKDMFAFYNLKQSRYMDLMKGNKKAEKKYKEMMEREELKRSGIRQEILRVIKENER